MFSRPVLQDMEDVLLDNVADLSYKTMCVADLSYSTCENVLLSRPVL